jgi:uncharacterized protein (DUF58 family)
VRAPDQAFPLVPRRRVIGLSFGAVRSARRGRGTDVAGSRPYRPGDDVRAVDWRSSARLSSARGVDEFVVRESFVEEAPRAVLVADRRPSMSLYAPPLPWLHKEAALDVASRLVLQSTLAARGYLGYVDVAEAEALWLAPRTRRELLLHERPFTAPDDSIERSFACLAAHRAALPQGSFVFVMSDFLAPPPETVWIDALERRWDVVPVVIQDPVWDASFPDVAGVVVPFVDARTGRTARVRLTRRETAALRERNERRRAELFRLFDAYDLQPVLVDSSEPAAVLDAFLAWAAWRQRLGSVRR